MAACWLDGWGVLPPKDIFLGGVCGPDFLKNKKGLEIHF